MAATSVHGLITPLEPDHASPRWLEPSRQAVTAGTYVKGQSRLEAAAFSACGLHHGTNEDTHSPLCGDGRLFAVADGVGGGAEPDLASRELVAHLHEQLGDGTRPLAPGDAQRVTAAVLDADRAIAAAIARITPHPGAATAALCAPVDAAAANWLVAWVGDCRVYRWSGEVPRTIECLTRDDTFGELGEPPPPGGSRDDPARMVGNGATHGANCGLHALPHDSLLAICSDGVHKHLESSDWCRVLSLPLPLTARCEALVVLARERGSADDATVLLVERTAIGPARARFSGAHARQRRIAP